jgi:hypothetical protein
MNERYLMIYFIDLNQDRRNPCCTYIVRVSSYKLYPAPQASTTSMNNILEPIEATCRITPE